MTHFTKTENRLIRKSQRFVKMATEIANSMTESQLKNSIMSMRGYKYPTTPQEKKADNLKSLYCHAFLIKIGFVPDYQQLIKL